MDVACCCVETLKGSMCWLRWRTRGSDQPSTSAASQVNPRYTVDFKYIFGITRIQVLSPRFAPELENFQRLLSQDQNLALTAGSLSSQGGTPDEV